MGPAGLAHRLLQQHGPPNPKRVAREQASRPGPSWQQEESSSDDEDFGGESLSQLIENHAAASRAGIFYKRLFCFRDFWLKHLRLNPFIQNVIEQGYTLPFISVPEDFEIKNYSSSFQHCQFVCEEIQKLCESGSVVKLSEKPKGVNV